MSRLVIAVDSSTTATKAIVVDERGEVLATGRCPIAMHQPFTDAHEHDAREWVTSTNLAITEAVGLLSTEDRARIDAVCATVQRQSFCLVDADGEPLRPGILWLDARATAQVARLGSDELHELTGFQPDVTPSLYKIAWLAEHEPETLRSAHKLVGVHGLLVHALTGRWVDSSAAADSLGLFDMAHQRFDEGLLARVGLSCEQMCELVAPGTVIAPVLGEVSRGWGLPGTVQLVAGCGDGQAAALGCGAIGPSEAYLNMGTALVAGVHSSGYRTGDVFRTDAAGLAGQFVCEIVQNSGAYLAGWFRSELVDPALAGAPDPALDEAASRVTPGVGGLSVLPYWNAVQSPHWDPLARGAIVGLSGIHGRAEIYRALLEGLSLEMARNLRGLQRATGVPLESVRVMGGGQRSRLWRRIMTDCVGLPLVACETEEVSALGAAMLAMSAVGVHADVPAAARAMARLGDVSTPDEAAASVYRELDELQARLYPALAEVFTAQADFASRHPLG